MGTTPAPCPMPTPGSVTPSETFPAAAEHDTQGTCQGSGTQSGSSGMLRPHRASSGQREMGPEGQGLTGQS